METERNIPHYCRDMVWRGNDGSERKKSKKSKKRWVNGNPELLAPLTYKECSSDP